MRRPNRPALVNRPPTRVGGRFRAAPRQARSGAVILVVMALATGAAAQPLARLGADSQPAASQPTTAPRGPAHFQPGVMIDWQERAVIVASRVVLRRGPLEFFACLAGKEHESILRLEASAMHIYMALGLIGLTPGHPPTWDDAINDYRRPGGDLVEITCEWEQDGRERTVDAFEWLRESKYGRTPIPRPWVFAGSLRLSDGSLASDHSGAGLALVDFSEAFISLSRGRSSRSGELWAEANTAALPPKGTRVRLILRPARPRDYRVSLDFRGQAFLDGRFVSLPDLADLLSLARQLNPQRVQAICVAGSLHSDVRRVRSRLAELGLPPAAVRFSRASPTTAPSPAGWP